MKQGSGTIPEKGGDRSILNIPRHRKEKGRGIKTPLAIRKEGGDFGGLKPLAGGKKKKKKSSRPLNTKKKKERETLTVHFRQNVEGEEKRSAPGGGQGGPRGGRGKKRGL